jgi:hypothetical protein
MTVATAALLLQLLLLLPPSKAGIVLVHRLRRLTFDCTAHIRDTTDQFNLLIGSKKPSRSMQCIIFYTLSVNVIKFLVKQLGLLRGRWSSFDEISRNILAPIYVLLTNWLYARRQQ